MPPHCCPPGGATTSARWTAKPGLALNGRHQYGGNVVWWCIPVVTSAAAARLVVTTGVSGKTNAITPAAAVLNIAVIPAAGKRSRRLIPNQLLSDESAPCATCHLLREGTGATSASLHEDGSVHSAAFAKRKKRTKWEKKIKSMWLLYTQLNNACDKSVVGRKGRGEKRVDKKEAYNAAKQREDEAEII